MTQTSGPAAEPAASAVDADALLAMVDEFARNEIGPRVQDYDEREELPRDLLERMADLHLFGGVVDERWGGLGLDYVTFARLVEHISRVCHVMGTLVSMPSGLAGASLERFGTDEQK